MNIGLIGKLGAGKTFAAQHLIDKYGFQRISLATPIKDIMSEYLGIRDKTHPDYRRMAQKIGTDWFRSEYPDIWIDYMIKKSKEINHNYICDDVRFVNEAEKLINNNWILIYLDCPEDIRIERCKKRDGVFDYSTLNHPSETGVDDIIFNFATDIFFVDSNGTIENTNKQLDEIMNNYLNNLIN
jgi:dephospho-CoA kinase